MKNIKSQRGGTLAFECPFLGAHTLHTTGGLATMFYDETSMSICCVDVSLPKILFIASDVSHILT